jgi:hypothetical protein
MQNDLASRGVQNITDKRAGVVAGLRMRFEKAENAIGGERWKTDRLRCPGSFTGPIRKTNKGYIVIGATPVRNTGIAPILLTKRPPARVVLPL